MTGRLKTNELAQEKLDYLASEFAKLKSEQRQNHKTKQDPILILNL